VTAGALECDVLVVGAGPAGMAAAAAASEVGADVVCLDLFSNPGGQFHMRPVTSGGPFDSTSQVAEGRLAERRCRERGVRFLEQTEVFWAEPGFTTFASQANDPVAIRSTALVVATGAMERALPFKGWTLPGVMTAGAAQRLIKTSNAPPGRHVMLAGSGPFLLAVANTFGTAGQKLEYYVEMQRFRLAALSLLLANPGRLKEAAKLLAGVRRSGAKILTGHQVVEAMGSRQLEAVRVAPLDETGKPITEKSKIIENVDALCVGYGFRPIVDVTSVLDASHHFDDTLGGWVCSVDEQQATSVVGLFAAGETTGIGGAVCARLSGRISGLNAAAITGRYGRRHELELLGRRLKGARSFAAGLARIFPFPGHLVEQLGDDEIICRCEDVKMREIGAAISDGASDVFGVKMWTRAGMGACQGRICGTALSEIVARRMDRPVSDAGYNRPHMPLRPVSLSTADLALGLVSETEET